MGMAASQARYLGLAARRTNCEYQGQQINQARTALANQSAELWNQMLGLSVPVVPNPQNFAKTQYSFSDGYNSFEIKSMVPTDKKGDDGTEYNYSVTYRYFEQEVEGMERTNTNPQVQGLNPKMEPDGTFKAPEDVTVSGIAVDTTVDPRTYTKGDLTECTAEDIAKLKAAFSLGTDPTVTDYVKYKAADGKVSYCSKATLDTAVTDPSGIQTVNDITFKYVEENMKPNYKEATLGDSCTIGNSKAEKADFFTKQSAETVTTLRKLLEDCPKSRMSDEIRSTLNAYDDYQKNLMTKEQFQAANKIYTYTKNGSLFYSCKSDIEDAFRSGTRPSVDPNTLSGIDKQDPLQQYYTVNVQVEKETTDYAIMDDASGSGRFASIQLSGYSKPFLLNTETATNDKEYEDALNQYYYDVQKYEKAQADINAKTKRIQEQDRTLELRLKQLDTEHTALQTEMEAVKKVITKNVEETFKTFGG